MESIKLLKSLEEYPLFDIKVLSDIIGKDKSYAKLAAYRLKNKGIIHQIEKNKYTIHKDPLIVASNLMWPSYVSVWYALRYYNLTEQLPQVVEMITTRPRKKRDVDFSNVKITFIRTKPKYLFGYKKEIYNGFPLFIAEKEKALLDAAIFKRISLSEIDSIVKKNIRNIDTNLIVKYLIKIKNKALIKRFGFLLERLGKDNYKKLSKFIDYKYIPLDYSLPKSGNENKKWRVDVNY